MFRYNKPVFRGTKTRNHITTLLGNVPETFVRIVAATTGALTAKGVLDDDVREYIYTCLSQKFKCFIKPQLIEPFIIEHGGCLQSITLKYLSLHDSLYPSPRIETFPIVSTTFSSKTKPRKDISEIVATFIHSYEASYYNTIGVLNNSIQYIVHAATLHYPPALYNLGLCYQKGLLCVKKNIDVAEEFYKRAAVQGHLGATSALVQMWLENGNRDGGWDFIFDKCKALARLGSRFDEGSRLLYNRMIRHNSFIARRLFVY